jgi:hypothetical protein
MKQIVELIRDGSVTPQSIDKSADRTLRAVLVADGTFLYNRFRKYFKIPNAHVKRYMEKHFYSLPKLLQNEISRLQLGR